MNHHVYVRFNERMCILLYNHHYTLDQTRDLIVVTTCHICHGHCCVIKCAHALAMHIIMTSSVATSCFTCLTLFIHVTPRAHRRDKLPQLSNNPSIQQQHVSIRIGWPTSTKLVFGLTAHPKPITPIALPSPHQSIVYSNFTCLSPILTHFCCVHCIPIAMPGFALTFLHI
jgi:hypothetical protein